MLHAGNIIRTKNHEVMGIVENVKNDMMSIRICEVFEYSIEHYDLTFHTQSNIWERVI